MKRLLTAALVGLTMTAGLANGQAPLPDWNTVSQNRDWRGLLLHYNDLRGKGNMPAAAEAYRQAWDAAMFWAVYDPAKTFTSRNGMVGSGTRRTDGLAGLRAIIQAGPPDNSWDAVFPQFQDLQRQNPPQVLSGGRNNIGLWRSNLGGGPPITLVQQGSRVVARGVDPSTNRPPEFDLGQNAFNGNALRLDIRANGMRVTGALNYAEPGVLSGDLTLTITDPATGQSSTTPLPQLRLVRMYNGN
jgi:hypothetical protein